MIRRNSNLAIPFRCVTPTSLFLLLALLLVQPHISEAREWVHSGPFGAWVTAVSIDPVDTSIVYIGTEGRGVWRSTDNGLNWVEVSAGLPVWTEHRFGSPSWWNGEQLTISVMIHHPSQSGLLWAGTSGGGLFFSSDGGLNWSSAGEGLPEGVTIYSMFVKPNDPDILFVGMDGLYRSTDGGVSWSLLEQVPHGSTYRVVCIQGDPGNPDHLYTGIGSAGEPDFAWGLMESWDSGDSWAVVNQEFTFHELQIHPEDNQLLWAVVYTGYMEWMIFKSTDGGQTWSVHPDISDPWNWVLRLYQDAGGNLFVQDVFQLWKSVDFGQTWSIIASDIPTYASWDHLVHIAVNPRNVNSVFIGFDNGIYHSNDGGVTNFLTEEGIDNSYIQAIVAHPSDPDILYVGGGTDFGFDSGGFWKSDDGGMHWIRLAAETVTAIAIDPLHPDTLYRGGRSLMRSYDGGQNWVNILRQISNLITALAIHPIDTNILYYGTVTGGVFRSYDRGDSWEAVEIRDPYSLSAPVNDIIIPEYNPNEIYIGQLGIYKSEDAGLTWNYVAIENDPLNRVTSMILDPIRNRIYVVLWNYYNSEYDVIVSTDGGTSFERIGASLAGDRIFEIIINPASTGQLLVTTETSLFETNNDGASWNLIEGPYKHPLTLELSSDHRTLFLGTHGYGVWSTTDFVGVDDDRTPRGSMLPTGPQLLPAYPNPFNESTLIRYQLPDATLVTIRIFSTSGQLVETLVNSGMSAGYHRVPWNRKNLASGLYIVTMQAGNFNEMKKVVLLK